jgi:FkbM family methyltransferase
VIEITGKLINVFRTEGLLGIKTRFYMRYSKIKYVFLHLAGKSNVVSFYGVILKKNWLDATFRYYVFGSYGTFFSDHLKNKKEEFAFLDIGANQGLYTLIAAKNLLCSNATAFEPVKSTYSLLLENLKINNVSNTCTIINKGIGKSCGIVHISVPIQDSGCASQINHFKSEWETIEQDIEIVNGDFFNELEISKISCNVICKIDVEGKEKDVIKALISSNMINKITEIFYELDERWADPEEIKGLLGGCGFNNFHKIGSDPIHYDVLASR